MTGPERRSEGGSPGRAVVGYALVVAAVWLGWETLKAPLIDRAPPAIGLRLAPGSPSALRRAAEDELLAEEWDDAAYLSDQSLARAPFNARALRVRGLAAARTGADRQADELLTLAGNWSLRDDPAHAWLVEQRLRQGSYASAFAHADTLARRRRDLEGRIFELFTVAAVQDSRAIPPLVGLLAADPPWRGAYLANLQARADGDALLLNLGVALQSTAAPLSDLELSRIYRDWLAEGRIGAIAALRRELDRPSLVTGVQNGNFSQPLASQLAPFGWSVRPAAGLAAEIVDDDLQAGNAALRIDYDGYSRHTAASQLLLLGPGAYAFQTRFRRENESPASFEWIISCAQGGEPLMRQRLPAADEDGGRWSRLDAVAQVPEGCPAQRLVLAARPADRRSPLAIWFDDVTIRPLTAATPDG